MTSGCDGGPPGWRRGAGIAMFMFRAARHRTYGPSQDNPALSSGCGAVLLLTAPACLTEPGRRKRAIYRNTRHGCAALAPCG